MVATPMKSPSIVVRLIMAASAGQHSVDRDRLASRDDGGRFPAAVRLPSGPVSPCLLMPAVANYLFQERHCVCKGARRRRIRRAADAHRQDLTESSDPAQ